MTAPNWTPCRVSLGALKPWAANPRLSTKAQAKRILASFQKFGQGLPDQVLVNAGQGKSYSIGGDF